MRLSHKPLVICILSSVSNTEMWKICVYRQTLAILCDLRLQTTFDVDEKEEAVSYWVEKRLYNEK